MRWTFSSKASRRFVGFSAAGLSWGATTYPPGEDRDVTKPQNESAITPEQSRILPRLTKGAVVFHDVGTVICGTETIHDVSVADLEAMVHLGMLLRLSERAFELTAHGRRLAGLIRDGLVPQETE
jgi:hypothetical protein